MAILPIVPHGTERYRMLTVEAIAYLQDYAKGCEDGEVVLVDLRIIVTKDGTVTIETRNKDYVPSSVVA